MPGSMKLATRAPELATCILGDETDRFDLDAQPKKSRKRSIVWDHFKIETIDNCARACCKKCKKSFAYTVGAKLAGTSHLKRHINMGICPALRRTQERNLLPVSSDTKTDVSSEPSKPPRKQSRLGSANFCFDENLCNFRIAMMVILHDYPLEMVEHSGFVDFARSLQRQFKRVCINSIREHCLGVYKREKDYLLNLIGGIPGRVNLTLDLWNSNQSTWYAFFTGHFVDNELKLQRRILKVVRLPSPDIEVSLSQAFAACVTEWSLESKLFTVTLDQSVANNCIKEKLREFLSISNPLILNGQLIVGSCFAHTLSCLANDAFRSMKETINKVRQSVKYVKMAKDCEEKFFKLKEKLQVPGTRILVIDDQTKWHTTYQMLVGASESKEVFSCLDTSDPNYKDSPSMSEWMQVDTLCTYVKLLFDTANMLNSPTYPTANAFFVEVCKLLLELNEAAIGHDPFISNLTKPLQEKLDKYWKECCLVLSTAAVMDPRFKMRFIEFSFSRIYVADAEIMVRVVDKGVHELFLDYVVKALPPPTFVEVSDCSIPKIELAEEAFEMEIPQGESFFSATDEFFDFDVSIPEIIGSEQIKSELDQYLEESLERSDEDFDVLGWWKLNQAKYPTLSKMAYDVLCLPISMVAPNTLFDIANRKMDGS